MLKEEFIEKYKKSRFRNCPHCGGYLWTDNDNVAIGQDCKIKRNVYCDDCEKEWTEVLALTDVISEDLIKTVDKLIKENEG